MCGKKEIEFLELKQGNSTIFEYATRFEELVKFFPYYNNLIVKASKCIKFENGLHPEVKQGIGYQEIRQFPILVNKCRIYDQDTRAKSSFYKSYNDKKEKNQDRGKSYSAPADKGKQKVLMRRSQVGEELSLLSSDLSMVIKAPMLIITIIRC